MKGNKMKINLAHIREHSTSGGWIDFAVFDAHSSSNTDSANAEVLAQLTAKARISGLKIDQSALAFNQSGRIQFYGTPNLVEHLSRSGLPRWTHSIDA
jgi:hypothetical protein